MNGDNIQNNDAVNFFMQRLLRPTPLKGQSPIPLDPTLSDPNVSRFLTQVQHPPLMEGYKPSWLRRLGSIAIGAKYGPEEQEQYLDIPYHRALQDWSKKLAGTETAASFPASLAMTRAQIGSEGAFQEAQKAHAELARAQARNLMTPEQRIELGEVTHPAKQPSLLEELAHFEALLDDPNPEVSSVAKKNVAAITKAMEESHPGSVTAYKDMKKEHPDWTIEQIQDQLTREYQRVFPFTTETGATPGFVDITTGVGKPKASYIPVGSIPGVPTPSIPPKPTTTMLTMGQRAATVRQQIPNIINQINSMRDQLGPYQGRYNDLMVGKIGTDMPGYASLMENLDLLASGMALAHGINAQMARDNFRKYLGESQTPDDLIARIQTVDQWMEGYAAAVGKGTEQKVATKDQISAYAKKHNISIVRATQIAQQEGYRVER